MTSRDSRKWKTNEHWDVYACVKGKPFFYASGENNLNIWLVWPCTVHTWKGYLTSSRSFVWYFNIVDRCEVIEFTLIYQSWSITDVKCHFRSLMIVLQSVVSVFISLCIRKLCSNGSIFAPDVNKFLAFHPIKLYFLY